MNATPHNVSVSLAERSYSIQIGTGNLPRLGHSVLALRPFSRAIIITDDNLHASHAAQSATALREVGLVVDQLAVPAGEASKCVASATHLWERMLELNCDRATIVVAVGGGVIGDLAGFVAATFARGLPFLQVPTTLLAQVDSSVGGKVGVNLPGAKNMVGTFWQPIHVLIDTATLATLPQREYLSGLAEVVKYGVILDAEFFAYLEAHVTELLDRRDEIVRQVVARCCELKALVVSQDEREETGQRAVLNYGHTFCHAFETLTGYASLLHGEGVAIGMLCASRLAERLGRIHADVTRRQLDLLLALGLPVQVPQLATQEVLATMARDKKSTKGRLNFVLPSRLGHVELVRDVDAELVRGVLESDS